MTNVQVKDETCPNCDMKIKWDELGKKGWCPNCKKEFIPKKIRFL